MPVVVHVGLVAVAARGGDFAEPGAVGSLHERQRTLEAEDAGNGLGGQSVLGGELVSQVAPAPPEFGGNVTDLRRAVARAAAARTAVIGPVIEVQLNDAPVSASNIPEGFTVDDVVVHQQDVQAVVNALWAGGAEAMMLMDQRVISTSAVRCVGNTLILQGRVYSPPYVIQAMGDPVALKAALDADEKVAIYRQYVARLGLGYNVSAHGELTFPAYAGSITPVYAEATS